MTSTSHNAMRWCFALSCACILFAGCRPSAPTHPPASVSVAVIPAPASVERLGGSFTVTARTRIATGGNAEGAWIARYFANLVERTSGLSLPVDTRVDSAKAHAIAFVLDPAAPAPAEGYALTIASDGVTVAARDRRGLFYGAITLWQLWGQTPLPGLRIVDEPRFRWRGVMLDSARHYQSPEFIERFIDAMAIHKLNVLHWHLTDDQGWRLEIRKYPRLTQIGAWRVPAGRAAARDIDPATGRPRLYGGYYSQDTIRRIVDYATLRGVTIVPEIEMPGHATAPIVAYPQLGVRPQTGQTLPTAVPSDWGVYANLYNADESTFRFLEDVLDEVMALFPGEYIHVGGDEAVKKQWQASARVQERMQALGVANEAELQSYFVHRMEQYLRAHGRRLIGWDEILEGGIAPDATVMSWRGIEGALKAAHAGHDTVLSPWPTLYLDNRQSDASDDPPGRSRVITVEDMYRFDPMPSTLAPEERRHVLGLQADAWTEHMRTEDRVEIMTFPRVAAVAEVGWSPESKLDWNGFVARLVPEFERYRALGIGHSSRVFDVRIDARVDESRTLAHVTLTNQTRFGEIRYTLNGTDPDASSRQYGSALDIPLGGELRTATFEGARLISTVAIRKLDTASLARRSSRELKLCSERLAIALEDDAPIVGPRAVFMIDLMNPCWIYEGADLAHGASLTAAVGQVPFNFQIGEDVHKIELRKPRFPAGELEVRLDGCDGEPVASLPLAEAAARDDVTTLRSATISSRGGKHDLCLSFTQNGVDPMWAIDWIALGP